MKVKDIGGGLGVAALIALALLAVGGWIANVVAIVGTVNDPLGGMFILRCVGVFVAPLGSILGFF